MNPWRRAPSLSGARSRRSPRSLGQANESQHTVWKLVTDRGAYAAKELNYSDEGARGSVWLPNPQRSWIPGPPHTGGPG